MRLWFSARTEALYLDFMDDEDRQRAADDLMTSEGWQEVFAVAETCLVRADRLVSIDLLDEDHPLVGSTKEDESDVPDSESVRRGIRGVVVPSA
jgi:hypothetical protein